MQAGREKQCPRGTDSWENWGGTNLGGEVGGRRLKWHNPHVTWWGAGRTPGWALSVWQRNSTEQRICG